MYRNAFERIARGVWAHTIKPTARYMTHFQLLEPAHIHLLSTGYHRILQQSIVQVI